MSIVEQQPYIQNMTVRQNICFGEEFDQNKFDNVIKLCELELDLSKFNDYDETLIGDKGVTLTGGQKARVALARALYYESDLLVLDDTLAGLDVNVANQIVHNVLLSHLKNKTRIIITRSHQHLSLADRVIVMKEGQIILDGHYDTIKDKINESLGSIGQMVKGMNEKNFDSILDDKEKKEEKAEDGNEKKKDKKNKKNKNKGDKKDKDDEGKVEVSFATYWHFFKTYYGCSWIVCSLITMCLFLSSQILNDYTIGLWTQSKDQHNQISFYSPVTLGLTLLTSMMIVVRALSNNLFTLRASKRIHNEML